MEKDCKLHKSDSSPPSQVESSRTKEIKNTELFFEKATKDYEAAREWHRLFADYDRVLDLGCAGGVMEELDPKKYTGLDLMNTVVDELKAKGYNAVRGNATKIPFQNESFDGVMAKGLPEHLQPQDVYKMVKEVGRVLRPGGRFVIYCTDLCNEFWCIPTHLKPYPVKAVQRLLKEIGGWEVMGVIHHGRPIRGLRLLSSFFHKRVVNYLARHGYRRFDSILIVKKLCKNRKRDER